MNRITRKRTTASERLIVSLPKALVLELRRFATKYRGGNKSGFVADAIESHISRLRKARHTARLRKAYADAAEQSMRVAEEWEQVDNESWTLLDQFETGTTKAKRS